MVLQVKEILNKLINKYPELSICTESIISSYDIITSCYKKGGKILICGNGGSAADADHIVGELMKGFVLKRSISSEKIKTFKKELPDDWQYITKHLQGALPAISLNNNFALCTAYINDVQPDMVYAQQVFGYSKPGDVVVGLSTSGNSKNIINAFKTAKALKLETIGFTGETGGFLKNWCSTNIAVPAIDTYMIQEYHMPVYHTICAMLEVYFFNESV